MKWKVLGVIAINLLFGISAYSQYSISGKVISHKNQPVEFTTVALKKDSTTIHTTLTDSLGGYKISNIKAGKYTILFASINFDKKIIPIYLTRDSIINTQLWSKAQSLQEITITSKKPLIERKTDRLVFNVEKSTIAIGADALEALAKTPGVKADNKGISLLGKGGVGVMIDDRLSPLSGDDLINVLKSMSAEDIAKIEVITNPGAQYDAQGNNGLINIVTKRSSKLGYTGSLRLSHTQSSFSTLSSGGNLNYNKDNFKFHGNINARKGSNAALEQFTYFYPTQTWEQTDNRRDYNKLLYGQLGVNYQASKTTFIGILYDGFMYKPDIKEHIVAPVYNTSQGIDYTSITHADSDMRGDENAINLHLKQLLDHTGKQIVVNGDWFTSDFENQRTYTNTNFLAGGQVLPNSFSQYLSGSKQRIGMYTVKADVELPFKNFAFATGTKLSFINTKNDVSKFQLVNTSYRPDYTQTNQFNYVENTQALYINLSAKKKKWDFQTGLRGEFTQTEGTSITDNQINRAHYFKLFPTLFITYAKDDKHVFSINYGKRINRPNYDHLNPSRWYLSPYAYVVGNPFLQPSFNNNFELSHTYKGFLTTALSFNNENNGSSQVTFIETGPDIQATRVQNFLTSYSYQLNSSVVVNTLKWLESTNQFNIYYQTVNSSLPQVQGVQGWGAYISTNNQILFNQTKTIVGDVNFGYQFPSIDGICRVDALYSLGIGLKAALNQKTQIAINASDILKSSASVFHKVVNQINQMGINYYDARQFRVSISYKFGNSKIKREEYQTGNEDERKRVN